MSNSELQPKNQPVILQYLDKFKSQIAAALPKHMSADRMARIVTTEIRKTPELLNCNPQSLFGAVIQASQLGLEPGSALGHCYLLPFNNKSTGTKDVQLIIGYRGMIDLARRSGQIRQIVARVVYEEDEFSYQFGLHEDLQHVPSRLPAKQRGRPTHYYAVAQLMGGGAQWDVLTLEEVEDIREQSKAKKFGPWVTHFDEMAKKSVIRRLFKYLPVSIEMQSAVGVDEMADAGVSQQNAALLEGDFEVLPGAGDNAPGSGVSAVSQKLGAAPAVTFAQAASAINKAKGKAALDECSELVAQVADEAQRGELLDLIKQRKGA